MTPEQSAHDTRDALVGFAGRWMMDASTYGRGNALGFAGMDFYLAGRGGALGDVSAEVATAALVFFAPHVVRDAWQRSAGVMPRADAARAWAATGHEWAREHCDDALDWATLAALAGRVVQSAPVAAAPLFAGWRELDEPEDATALALHRCNALRELRGALHAAAVLTVGLAPVEALVVHTPKMLKAFGWPEPHPEAKPFHERWALAEARTDRMFGRHLAVLDAEERTTFVELLQATPEAIR